MNTGYVD